MNTEKVILLQGLAKGGTNIVWNILQSHPHIVSTVYEINEIIKGKRGSQIVNGINILLNKTGPTSAISRTYFRHKFKKYALLNLKSSDNKYKAENIEYTKNEILKATHCLKGVNSPRIWDLKYGSIIRECYSEYYDIALVRDGFSVCEGWIRRGYTAKQAGYYYARFCDEILSANDKLLNYKILKFEDVISNPFSTSEDLFHYVSEAPTSLEALRFKVKKTVSQTGEHKTKFGEENRKYWFNKDNISQLFDERVNHNQRKNLTVKDEKEFRNEAFQALQEFQYLP